MGGEAQPVMSDERVVFQTDYGDITFGFWPEVNTLCHLAASELHMYWCGTSEILHLRMQVAPVTCEHIFTLVRLGCYVRYGRIWPCPR